MGQLSGVVCGWCFGIVLVCVAVVFLLWNEGRAVRRACLLDEALSRCHPLTNIDVTFDSNNGHLVHLTGALITTEPLEETHYGVSVWAVRLRRVVEMCQWVEECYTRKYEEDGETKEEVTYYYSKKWKSTLIDSSLFDESWFHSNPSTFPIGQKEWKSQTMVGSFHLSAALVELLTDWWPVELSFNDRLESEGVILLDNVIYYSNNPTMPEVGDVRLKYEAAGHAGSSRADLVSIIARQSQGAELTAYYSADLEDELLLLYTGTVSHEEMLSKEHTSNIITTWLFRGIGWCGTFIGFLLFTNLGMYLVKDIPVIRELVGCGLLIANVILASSVTLITIAIGWLRHRPLIAVALLFMATIPYMMMVKRQRPQ